MEKDGRFDKALQKLHMKWQLYKNFDKTMPGIAFPPSQHLEQLPYTVMNAY